MAIKFEYKIPDNLLPLVQQTIVDYGSDYLYGYMPEGLAGQLQHCSLYMVCEFESNNGVDIWKNPLAIVSNNEVNAVETYSEATGSEIPSVLCEIVNRCDKIVVRPCE